MTYFTFGQGHHHTHEGTDLDKDIVVAFDLPSDEARDKMFELFGPKWSMQYDEKPPRTEFFPRGLYQMP